MTTSAHGSARAATLDDARELLQARFGYPDFRAGQSVAVESILAGRDTLVVLPTGGGKSICYQIPALLLPGLTVVISPLISLMKDQVDALERRDLPATFVNSTLSSAEVSSRLARVQRREIKLLYVAPERFDAGSLAERLRDTGVSLLAVDEAHCISEWGHDFRPSYLRIAGVKERLGNPPVVALTATATPHVRRDIVAQLRLRDTKTIITGFDRTNLRYHVVPTRTDADKDEALVGVLRAHDGVAVVYAATRRTVERIAAVVARARIPSVAYHAGLDDDHRREVQEAFMTERVRVIVATNAFGMGIDKPNVRLVVHHAMPGTLEAYYQEAGRAGRDGNDADCYLLHAFQDRFTHEFFIRGAHPERATVERVYKLVRKQSDGAADDPVTAESIAGRIGGKVSAREVESAIKILSTSGALHARPEQRSRAHVRLLAAPARISRELSAPESAMELGLLRALWRATGGTVEAGTLVDLDGLPPGFGGAREVGTLLDALQARQFIEWRPTGGGVVPRGTGTASARLPVDWETLDRRRRAELGKLDMMQKYAYTKTCRRGFVLRYFGDAAARERCTGCDNCLGTRIEPSAKEAAPSRRTRRTRQDADARGARGSRTARGDRPPRDAATADDASVVAPADAALLEQLREFRRRIARETAVPAYVVFTDRTLAEIAVRRPRSEDALASIRGVGPAKLARYADRVLEIVRASDDTHAA